MFFYKICAMRRVTTNENYSLWWLRFDREPYTGPLTRLDNVILTPPIGSYAKETRLEMEMQAAKNLLGALNTHTDIEPEKPSQVI